MPGFEVIGSEESQALQDLFSNQGGVLFAHGFDAKRNGYFKVRELERQFAARLRSKHCQAVSSGTAAQLVLLRSMGIKPGDEVITQAFTFIATVEAIVECGATPVMVDVDESLNMCPAALEDAITVKTKCIMPVHMLGNQAPMNEILEVGKKYNIPVVEDACEALGATYYGKPIGTLGKAGFFSLDFGKTITCGEGGLIVTSDTDLYTTMAAFHDHGHANAPGIPRGQDPALCRGFNFRMTEMQGTVALVQLKKLDEILEANRRNKKWLKNQLEGAAGGKIKFRKIIDSDGELADTLMFFVDTADRAKALVKALSQNGVGTKNVPDAMNWHFADRWAHIWKDQPKYATTYSTAWKKSADLLEKCVSLPIMVRWTDEQRSQIAEKIISAIKTV